MVSDNESPVVLCLRRITQPILFFQFMHEFGHNFGSGHTHDVWAEDYPYSEIGGYSPQIDSCGWTCPSQLPLVKSSTIMSYCHQCSGGYCNIGYTFGGKYKGTVFAAISTATITFSSQEPCQLSLVGSMSRCGTMCLLVERVPNLTQLQA